MALENSYCGVTSIGEDVAGEEKTLMFKVPGAGRLYRVASR